VTAASAQAARPTGYKYGIDEVLVAFTVCTSAVLSVCLVALHSVGVQQTVGPSRSRLQSVSHPADNVSATAASRRPASLDVHAACSRSHPDLRRYVIVLQYCAPLHDF